MKKIYVTRPSIPIKSKFNKYLNDLYHSRILTTQGKFVPMLENKLKKILGVKYLCITCNGTIALEVALKVLGIKSGVLLSPFSYVSTPNACKWLNLKTYFSDIEERNYSIDVDKIDKKLINKIDCIMPTHVFGIEANISKLKKFASKYKKKIIYDAAHCFKIKYRGKSILNNGDASILSFQATKIFNTCEGGAIIFKKKKDYLYAKKLINIGYNYFDNKKDSPIEGTNAKMSELHAAWGLALLPNINKIINKKKKIYNYYLKNLDQEKFQIINNNRNNNYNYVPVKVINKSLREKLIKKLNSKNIYPRKYFYPSLNLLKHLKGKKLKVSENLSDKILCLPISDEIKTKRVKFICNTLNNTN